MFLAFETAPSYILREIQNGFSKRILHTDPMCSIIFVNDKAGDSIVKFVNSGDIVFIYCKFFVITLVVFFVVIFIIICIILISVRKLSPVLISIGKFIIEYGRFRST